MEGSLLLPLSDGLVIEQICRQEQQIIISVSSTAASESIHSHYLRTVADLPEVGQLVILKLRVRRFFCRNALCTRRIFTERLASTGSALGTDDQSASRGTACPELCHLCRSGFTPGPAPGNEGVTFYSLTLPEGRLSSSTSALHQDWSG
jgi:hypothetical protein